MYNNKDRITKWGNKTNGNKLMKCLSIAQTASNFQPLTYYIYKTDQLTEV